MPYEDRYGLPLSTPSEAAAAAYREGIDGMLSAWPGVTQALDSRDRGGRGFCARPRGALEGASDLCRDAAGA